MNRIIRSYFLLFLSITFCAIVYGQTELSKVFDDGRFSSNSNLIKLNLAGLVASDLSFQYERVLSDMFSVELGLGTILPYKGWEFNDFFEKESTDGLSLQSGFSFSIAPRLYAHQKAPQSFYISPAYMHRHKSYEDVTIKIDYWILQSGFQWFISKRLLFEYNVGLGAKSVRTSKLPDYYLSDIARYTTTTLAGTAAFKFNVLF